MKKLATAAFALSVLIAGAFAEEGTPQVKTAVGVRAGINLNDQDGKVSVYDGTYINGGFSAEVNGTGFEIGATTLVGSNNDAAMLLPGAKWERMKAYTTMWDGLLYVAVGADEVRDFMTMGKVSSTELVGKYMGQGLSGLYADNPYGAFVKSSPIENLTLGAFMPVALHKVATPAAGDSNQGATEKFIAINDANGVANQTFDNALAMTEYAGVYKLSGIGSFYAGYMPYVKMSYAIASIQTKYLPALEAAVGFAYDWNESAKQFGGQVAAKAPKTEVAATATYTIGTLGYVSADAKLGIAPASSKAATPDATLFNGSIRGHYNVLDFLAVRMDTSVVYNSAAAKFGLSTAKELSEFILYPQVILSAVGTNGLINLGYKYNQVTNKWTLPLTVTASF